MQCRPALCTVCKGPKKATIMIDVQIAEGAATKFVKIERCSDLKNIWSKLLFSIFSFQYI